MAVRPMVLLVVLPLAGCGSLPRLSSRTATLSSSTTGDTLDLRVPTRVYATHDRTTCDFYLTDLPEGVWSLEQDLRDTSGVLLHITMFIEPKSGKTPIATTAVSGTVRCIVLAKGEVGVYGGGGFVDISGSTGDATIDATLSRATLRPLRATPGFRDRLGACTLDASIDAAFATAKVERLAALADALQREAPPIVTAPPAPQSTNADHRP